MEASGSSLEGDEVEINDGLMLLWIVVEWSLS